MNRDSLKMTIYFGERDRAEGGFLADALLSAYERHAFRTSVLLRGTEGFGLKRHLQTARLLTLSEDLPMVAVAVDTRERIEAALDEVRELTNHGVLTLERAGLLTGEPGGLKLTPELEGGAKLTVYLGRHQRIEGRPAHLAVVDLLHRCRVDGATVLLGVDGTTHGERKRARFLSGNDSVPLMIISVGAGSRIAAAVEELGQQLPQPLMTLERVRVCKRDGRRIAEPSELPGSDPSGLDIWEKLMVYSGGQARHAGRPLHTQLIRRLQEAGAMGATSLRGIWGYHGDHLPHGDSLWTLRRLVGVVTVVIDAPERSRRWFQILDEVTDESGLITSEMVPAFRAGGSGAEQGGLRLAARRSRRL